VSAKERDDLAERVGAAILKILRDEGNSEGSAIAQADGKKIYVYGEGAVTVGILVISTIDTVIVNH